MGIHGCRVCGVEFAHPQPSDELLAAIYSHDYFLGSEDAAAAERVAELKRATARLYLDAILPHVKTRGARLLEIGCGAGEFLLEAQGRGFHVEGVEYSKHSSEVANTRLSRNAVRVGSLETADLPPSSYDIIAGFDVLEHFRNPAQALECAYSALASGGLLVLVTPSLDSWSRRLLGRYWMEYKTEHLTYFNTKSLVRLLEQTGFKGIEFLPNYKVLSPDYIVRHFDKFPVPTVTPVVRFIYGMLPSKVAHQKVRIVASGKLAIARKAR